jgi:hypothetical protein
MGWKLYRGIPKTHNYLKKLAKLHDMGAMDLAPGVHDVAIAHDEWCGVYKGKHCNCNPDITITTLSHVRQQG